MKNSSLGTKILLALVTLGVLTYFGIRGFQFLDDPLVTTLAYTYQVEEKTDLSGYVVREEQVLTDSGTGLLRLQRTEGERVSNGGLVATVYADQSSLDLQNEIDALQTRLEQLQYAEEAALGAEASIKLDAQIMQRLMSLRRALTAERLSEAEQEGAELRTLVLKRDYTYSDTEDTADISDQLASLQAELTALRSQVVSSVQRITAPASGLYSAVVDGYETVLTPDSLADLLPSTLKTLKPDESTGSRVGKLILGDSWYYAAAMDAAEAAKLQESGSLALRFAKNVEQDLEVTILSVSNEENGRAVVVFRGKTYLSQLTMLRQQSAEVIRQVTGGIRVPTEALRAEKVTVDKEGNRTATEGLGVYCVVGMEARFKPVKVLYTGDGFVLVQATAGEDQEKLRLRAGDEVIISANNLYDGKVVG